MGFTLTDTDFYFALFQTDGALHEGVPKPASIILLTVGLFSILAIHRCRNSKTA